MSELRKCPFCQGDPIEHTSKGLGTTIFCSKCEGGIEYQDTPEQARSLWNGEKHG